MSGVSGFILRVVEPNGRQAEYTVQGELLIGSSEQNHIIVQDESVYPNHMTIGTDGNACWFREDGSGGDILVNGQRMAEGWLSGGEEIIIGQTRIHFAAPEIALPAELMAPADLDFDAPVSDGLDLADAGAFLDGDFTPTVGPPPKKQKSALWFAASMGIYVLGLVVLGLGGFSFAQSFLTVPKVQEVRDQTMLASLQKTVQAKSEMDKSQWKQAVQTLRVARENTPKKSPLRTVQDELMDTAHGEWDALKKYHTAKSLYTHQQRGGDALTLLRKIPKTRQIYPAAQTLYKEIYDKNMASLILQTQNNLAARKLLAARKSLGELLSYDPNHAKAAEFQLQLEKLEAATPEGRKRLRAARAKLQRGFTLFRRGNQSGALAFFRNFEKTASSLLKHEVRRHIRSITSFNSVLANGRKAYRRGNWGQAISLLSRARRMDVSLGGGNGPKYISRLAGAYYQQGNAAFRKKKYIRALRLFKRSNSISSNGRARGGIGRLRSKARALLKQAKLLRGIDNKEARRLTRTARQLLR